MLLFNDLARQARLFRQPRTCGGGLRSTSQTRSTARTGFTLGTLPLTAKPPEPATKPPKPKKLEAATPEHKALRWKEYKENGGQWDYDRWSKQYDTNMRNMTVELGREQQYRDAMAGVSETVKTAYTNRQIDVSIRDKDYMGQVKTGKISLTEQAKIDIQKDAFLSICKAW